MERNIKKNGLVNLAVALLIFLAGLGVTVFGGSLASQVASVFLGLTVLVTFMSWFQMRLEENEQTEKLELDELARSRGDSLFAARDAGSYPARNARAQFEKYFIPGFAILLLLLEAAATRCACAIPAGSGSCSYRAWRWVRCTSSNCSAPRVCCR